MPVHASQSWFLWHLLVEARDMMYRSS